MSARRTALSYQKKYGALIDDVGPRTPAAKAGLKKNDIVISYDKRPVRDPDHLIGLIQRSEVAKLVEIKVWRNKREVDTTVTLEEFNKDLATVPASRIDQSEKILRSMGVAVTYLSTRHRRSGISGVRVTRVMDKSAAVGSIQPNDIIYQVNQYRINQPNEFYDLIGMIATKMETEIYVIRNGKVLNQPIVISKLEL